MVIGEGTFIQRSQRKNGRKSGWSFIRGSFTRGSAVVFYVKFQPSEKSYSVYFHFNLFVIWTGKCKSKYGRRCTQYVRHYYNSTVYVVSVVSLVTCI